MKSKYTIEQTKTIITRLALLEISWFIMLILTMIISSQPATLIFGIWCLITGLVMMVFKKRYNQWYNNNLDNIKKIEEELIDEN